MKKPRRRRPNATGRNETEQYLKLSYEMMRSPAWRSLSGSAVKVWIELRCRFYGPNNGKLSLSFDEAARLLGMGKATVQRAFTELQDKGFVEVVRPGQWYGRLATEYAVTDRSVQGHLPTNAWKHWRGEKKRSFGSNADHILPPTVPVQNRGTKTWSA